MFEWVESCKVFIVRILKCMDELGALSCLL